jgi:hypothetical protein
MTVCRRTFFDTDYMLQSTSNQSRDCAIFKFGPGYQRKLFSHDLLNALHSVEHELARCAFASRCKHPGIRLSRQIGD